MAFELAFHQGWRKHESSPLLSLLEVFGQIQALGAGIPFPVRTRREEPGWVDGGIGLAVGGLRARALILSQQHYL